MKNVTDFLNSFESIDKGSIWWSIDEIYYSWTKKIEKIKSFLKSNLKKLIPEKQL